MKHIKPTELAPGMVTARDVLNRSGHLLLPAGTTLSERHIRMLQARDVPEVAVAGPEAPRRAAAAVAEAPLTAAQERQLLKRFQHHDPAHPFSRALKRLCRRRAAQPT